MYARNATTGDLQRALARINQDRYGGNLVWKRHPEYKGNRVAFTLTVRDSRGPGSRKNADGRRIAAACWHAHGDLFDALWAEGYAARKYPTIDTAGVDRMTNPSDNWQDRNIGSIARPLMYSEACDCADNGIAGMRHDVYWWRTDTPDDEEDER